MIMQERIYSNEGNAPLLDMLSGCTRLLDVGCGAGDNARLVKARYPGCRIYGITHSRSEAEIAAKCMEHCWVFDLEDSPPADLSRQTFDVLVFSHILEHLRDPAALLSRFASLLSEGGQILIAVPNVLSWRMRLKFLLGRFEYESSGVLDDTHLRFFTYYTADQLLLSQTPNLTVLTKSTTGSVPLWFLRHHFLPKSLRDRIDQWGCRRWPNLFGGQILIKAVKK